MKDFSQIDYIVTAVEIRQLVTQVAIRREIPMLDLAVKTNLHLPRFLPAELASFNIIQDEVERLADTIETNYKQSNLPAIHLSLRDEPIDRFCLAEAASEDVNSLIGKLHYLNSIRHDSINLALKYGPQNYTVGIISISDFDLYHLNIEPYAPPEVKVVSRIFTLENLPKNVPSYFIGASIRWLRYHYPALKLLLTYLNPNIGYSGTIYKATNWVEYAKECNVRYNYLKNDYVTDRFLMNAFGTAQYERLLALKIVDLEFSKISLHPLKILAYPLDPGFRICTEQDTDVIRE